jgi:hypothetical protein
MFKSMPENVPVQTVKAYERSGVLDPLILNVEVSGRHQGSAALPARRQPRYQLTRRLGGPQGPSASFGKIGTSLAP